MTVFDITAAPAPTKEEGLSMWREFIRQGTLSGDYSLRRKDGALVDVDFQAVASVMPGIHLSIVRDVTARKSSSPLAWRLWTRRPETSSPSSMADVGLSWWRPSAWRQTTKNDGPRHGGRASSRKKGRRGAGVAPTGGANDSINRVVWRGLRSTSGVWFVHRFAGMLVVMRQRGLDASFVVAASMAFVAAFSAAVLALLLRRLQPS